MEHLVAALGEALQIPLPSPQMPEWIGVQTQGLGIWLGMELSRKLGIWANVYQPFPRALIERIFQTVMGAQCPDTTRFEPAVLTWSVMSLLPELLAQPEFSNLAVYMADDPTGLKRFQLARCIADVYDRYAVYRPEMVLRWEASVDNPIEPEHRWQPILWRALVGQLGPVHVAAAAAGFFDTLRSDATATAGLPPRITLFGISTLPPLYLNVLSALPADISVNLFILNPSREYWAYIRSRREIIREVARSGAGQDALEEALYFEEGHRLLASLGRLGKEFQCLLEESADYAEPAGDLYSDPAPDPVSGPSMGLADDPSVTPSMNPEPGTAALLHQLQSDILNLRLRGPGGDPALSVETADPSVSIHACHSPMREVQVLHDRLLDVFQQDPSIAPHDVVVMVPDISEYAPVIEAVFSPVGAGESTIAYTISDQGMAGGSPVIQAFLNILRLARSRLPVQDVLDLLAMDPVREQFGLSSADMETARHWILDAGIRWGMSAEDRAAHGQPARDRNTWRFGLDRLLLGLAMPDETMALYQDSLPYAGIEGKESEILGRLVDFSETLFECLSRLRKTHTPAAWQGVCLSTLGQLVAANSDNAYQHQAVRDTLNTLVQNTAAAGLSETVGLEVVQAWLTAGFKQRPSIRGFLSGGVTFCNLLPMRSIPFKVVCLMGMNDGDYPRSKPDAGFDLMVAAPRIGDRSVRNDDRYLFLEALLSARERMMVFYVGQAIRDNTVIPPSVVVGELMDVMEEGYGVKRSDLLTVHPLHPFSPAYFQTDAVNQFSYSKEYLAGARALSGSRREKTPFLTAPLEEDTTDEAATDAVQLDTLIRFFNMPVDFFLRSRLGIVLQDRPDEIDSREPLTVSDLDRYQLGETLLENSLAGHDMNALLPLIRARGILPLGTPGECAIDDLVDRVAPIHQAVADAVAEDELPRLLVDLDVRGVRLTGELGDLRPTARVAYTAGGLTEKRKLALWIAHLVLNAMGDGAIRDKFPRRSVLIGRGKNGPEHYELAPIPERAGEMLADLVTVYCLGLSFPLPFFPATSHTFARVWKTSPDGDALHPALAAARQTWRGGYGRPWAESESLGVWRVFGDIDPLTAASELPGGSQDPDFSFSALALRVFGPMIDAEIQPTTASGKGGRK